MKFCLILLKKKNVGLAVLADFYPERILERLLQDFQRGPSLHTSNKEHSIETRLKVGEVLMRASRAMGAYQLLFFLSYEGASANSLLNEAI